MKERQEALYRKYENLDTGFAVEISTNMIKAIQIEKKAVGEGVRDTLLGHEFIFPDDMKAISAAVIHDIPKRGKRYERLRKVKAEEPEKYRKSTEHGTKKFIKIINEKHRKFDLGGYDAPNYTMSIFYFEGEEQ